ncbi:AGAP011739-PA, partial [Anopheles gambiae str. PEST]
MDLPDAGSPFDKLPSELIFSIFDYLELKSLKAVSLTCHRLEQMFADYSACRFVLRIREERNSYVFLPPLIEIADKVEAAT